MKPPAPVTKIRVACFIAYPFVFLKSCDRMKEAPPVIKADVPFHIVKSSCS